MTTRDEEVASALAELFRRGPQNGEWAAWADRLTPDAEFAANGDVCVRGRTAIRDALLAALAPVPCLTFSVEWMMTTGDEVAVWLWSHLPDPEGTEYGYDFPSLVLLSYGAAGCWKRIEAFYQPAELALALSDWTEAGGTAAMRPDHSLIASNPSHPRPPEPAPDDAIMEAVCDALVSENWLDLIETGGADWHDHGGYGIAQWADGERREVRRLVGGSRAVIVLDRGFPSVLVAHVNETGRVTYLDHLYDPAVLAGADS